jgi:hypothetical protein
MRPKVIQLHRLTKDERRINALLYPEKDFWRPKTRADCANVSRPCPYVGCRHHLYIDVDERSGSIRINYPDKEPWELKESCSLDIADQPEELTLEDIGEIMCVTRERIRQIESVAKARMKVGLDKLEEDENALTGNGPTCLADSHDDERHEFLVPSDDELDQVIELVDKLSKAAES